MARNTRAKAPSDTKRAKRAKTGAPSRPERRSGRLAIRQVVEPATPGQAAYVRAMRASDITICDGPAGTGKTFLAAGVAIAEIASAAESGANGRRERLIVCRPAVEAGERLGFAPGSIERKIAPYLEPIMEAIRLHSRDEDEFRSLVHPQNGVVQVCTFAHMRGRTFRDAWVILDEAQNTTEQQMEMFLGRMGRNTRLVVCGDIQQSDLIGRRGEPVPNGLGLALQLNGRRFERGRVAVVGLTWADVVRHDLIAEVLRATAEIREGAKAS